jgi:DNA-binding NarL/FixJ family response regulator
MHQSLAQPAKQTFLIVDDHDAILGGTLSALQQAYPEAELITARNLQEALQQVEQAQPSLVIADLVMPAMVGDTAQVNAGIQLLKMLMDRYPTVNIVVQSAHVRTLVWLKPAIDNHMGGFAIADKSQPMKELLTMVDWALKGRTYTPKEIRNGLQLKPEWFEVLQLAFKEGLQDTAIARRMSVSERTVQYYWSKIRDVLEVYLDEAEKKDKNIRIQTEMRARELGVLD